MPLITSYVKWPLKKVYYWLAQPLLARFREELGELRLDGAKAWEEVRLLRQDREAILGEHHRLAAEYEHARGELARATEQLTRAREDVAELKRIQEEVWDELTGMNQTYLDFHTTLTQQVTDEVTRLGRKLEASRVDDEASRRAA